MASSPWGALSRNSAWKEALCAALVLVLEVKPPLSFPDFQNHPVLAQWIIPELLVGGVSLLPRSLRAVFQHSW